MKKTVSAYFRARNTILVVCIVAVSFSCRTFADLSQPYNGSDRAKAKDALINFFAYLNAGQCDRAVPLFEPWEEGIGEHKSSWEGLSSFSFPEERNDLGKVLSNYCRSVGSCLPVEVLDVQKIAEGKYSMRVQFIKKDGSVFVRGPCCGAKEEQMPSTTVFEYYVHKLNGRYIVRTPPVYVP
jgi:hypothetical protein